MGFSFNSLLGNVGTALAQNFGRPGSGMPSAGWSVQSVARKSMSAPSRPRSNTPTDRSQGPKSGGMMMSGVRAVGRRFFDKYPNLATAIQHYRNMGMNQVTRSRLWGLLKRFGPELIISGGILTAAAVSELMMAGPGHRRMNPANAKALRRAARRLDSFHKLCTTTDRLRTRRRAKPCRTGGGQQFVRQG